MAGKTRRGPKARAPKTVTVFVPPPGRTVADMEADLREQGRVAMLRATIARQFATAARSCAEQVPGFVNGRIDALASEEVGPVADACQRTARTIVADIVAGIMAMASSWESSADVATGRAEMALSTAQELGAQRGPGVGTSGTIPAHPDGKPH